jgi:hypothetical protein
MLKEIKLTLAEKMVLLQLLSRNEQANTDTARKVRTLRRDLELKKAAKTFEAVQDQSWDGMIEYGEKAGPSSHTVEEDYLRWVQEQLQRTNWAEQRLQNGQTVLVPVSSSQLEVIADLADALTDALTQSPGKEA